MKTESVALCIALLEQVSEGLGALSDAFDEDGRSDAGAILGQYSEHVEIVTSSLRNMVEEVSKDGLVRN